MRNDGIALDPVGAETYVGELLGTLPKIPIYTVLLNEARSLINRASFDHYTYPMSIILTATACELCAETVLKYLVRTAEGLDGKKKGLTHERANYNLATRGKSRLRDLYNELTRETIQNAPFWQALGDGADLRNKIAHDGKLAIKEQAEAFLQAADQYTAHLERHLKPPTP